VKDGGYPQKGTAVSFFRRHIYYTMNASPFSPGDKVVGYCRYSEGDEQGQRNTSTEEQADAIRKFCDENQLVLVRIFADPFASGRSVAKRDQYLEMLSFLLHKKKPDIQGVILWDYERYGRNYDRAQYDAAQLRMKGYKLFSMQQPIADNSPFAHVLEAMYFASAQNQSDMISADVKRALQSNFTKHRVVPKTNVPDGWLAVPKKIGYYADGRERIGHYIVPDPKYKEKIKEAVEARLDGASMPQIRSILGGVFEKPHIKAVQLLKKPLLYGAFTYGGTTIEDFAEPIIDKETFDRLQIYNESQPKRRRSPGAGVYSLNRSLLSGLLVCGECGGRMHLDRRKAKGHLYETYYCDGYHIGVRRENIEDEILTKAIDLLSGEQWQNDLRTMLDSLQADDNGAVDKASIEKQIRQIDRSLKRLCDMLLETDKSPQFLIDKMNDLEDQKKDLIKQLGRDDDEKYEKIRTAAEESRTRILSVLKSKWTSTDEKREALSLFIPEITVYVKSRRELLVSVAHGIPGFLSVAEKTTKNDVRPWNYCSNTCNFTIPRRV